MLEGYPLLVTYLLLFLAVGIGFILVHLLAGKFVRPIKPEAEKLTIYECGEPTIGSAWIQFDLRFYVVALLFVIFDVEVAFFFPWAVVFGKANRLSGELPDAQRVQLVRELAPPSPAADKAGENWVNQLARRDQLLHEAQELLGFPIPANELRTLSDQKLLRKPGVQKIRDEFAAFDVGKLNAHIAENRAGARELAWFAFWDILVFFGVLLVGFAYLWRRGDLDWVRSTAAETLAAAGPLAVAAPGPAVAAPAVPVPQPVAGAGH